MRRNVGFTARKAGLSLISLSFTTLLAGCYHSVVVTQPPSESSTIITTTSERGTAPAYISRFVLSVNGVPISPATHFERKVLASFQDARLFTDVTLYANKPSGHYFDLKFSDDEKYDNGTNDIKMIFIAGTLFLLAPALPFTEDFEMKLTVTAERPDGQAKTYMSSCAGKSNATVNRHGQAVAELVKNVGDTCLRHLTNQMIADSFFHR